MGFEVNKKRHLNIAEDYIWSDLAPAVSNLKGVVALSAAVSNLKCNT